MRGLLALPRRFGGLMIDGAIGFVARHSRLKQSLLLLLGIVPGLRERAIRLRMRRAPYPLAGAPPRGSPFIATGSAANDIDGCALPASVRGIHLQLAAARAAHSS